MATTHVPDPRPIDESVSREDLLERVHETLLRAQGDEDKSTDPEDNCYYSGLVDALKWVEDQMTVPEETPTT